ncbi:FlgB family protein [Paracoccus sp. 1_MG-2023]|uniref:FlgB family protein n=1 Tax=unclassified Paracoccus (in: a-proteobacteria) TaxID=2688777 RepID=UPI001C09D891|nr:FlgB family protein [Paracoccus sp. 1_MG-2023]MBU2956894.1 FlgB family protein [Paracoccus sp. C2R09]MDO6668092.1 FlgB family protein [Paracoccus sp. 1_MG-2023]
MFENIEMMRMARALTAHAADRHVATARNIANADTPGYRATDLGDFTDAYAGAADLRVTDPRHLAAPDWTPGAARLSDTGAPMSPNGNSVSLEEELVRAADVKRQHDLSLAVFRSGLDLMRSGLGRN